MPSWGRLWGQHWGLPLGSGPQLRPAPVHLQGSRVPSWASPPALSGSVLLSHPPFPRIPCCATWSPQGQGVTNCQVRGGHLESAAWGWSHGEGSSRNSTPRPDTAWPCFSLEISTLPHPAEWPSATSSSLRCPGRLRPPPGPGQDATLRPESGSACRDPSPPPPPGSPTQAGPRPLPLLYCSLPPVLQATPALLPLALSRWLAQSPLHREKLRHRGDWTHWAPGPAHQTSHITHSCLVRSPGL